jgi:hypothetical protein
MQRIVYSWERVWVAANPANEEIKSFTSHVGRNAGSRFAFALPLGLSSDGFPILNESIRASFL